MLSITFLIYIVLFNWCFSHSKTLKSINTLSSFFIHFIIMSFYLNDNSISYAPSNLPSPLLVVVVVFSFPTYFIRLFHRRSLCSSPFPVILQFLFFVCHLHTSIVIRDGCVSLWAWLQYILRLMNDLKSTLGDIDICFEEHQKYYE